tara:strand:+ start:73 stop:402 length:330 start_codon:yes stop_codon:yes gene_type:complete
MQLEPAFISVYIARGYTPHHCSLQIACQRQSGGNQGDQLSTERRRPLTLLFAGQTMNCPFIILEINEAISHDFQRIAPDANLQIHSFAFLLSVVIFGASYLPVWISPQA